MSNDRQCIYSDEDGEGPTLYPAGDCTFGINIPLDIVPSGTVNVSAIGNYEVEGDSLRIQNIMAPIVPSYTDETAGPLDVLVNSDAEFLWIDVNTSSVDTGWTICIQELEEVMVTADSAMVLDGGETPLQGIEFTIDQSGLESTFMEGQNYTDVTGTTHNSTVPDNNLVWTAASVGNATVVYNLTTSTRLSGIVWWPNDGENVGRVDVRFSNDPSCDPSTFIALDIFIVSGNPSTVSYFEPTPTLPGDVVSDELIPLVPPRAKAVCVEFTLSDCTNECSIGEVAFIGPDITTPPVTPP